MLLTLIVINIGEARRKYSKIKIAWRNGKGTYNINLFNKIESIKYHAF